VEAYSKPNHHGSQHYGEHTVEIICSLCSLHFAEAKIIFHFIVHCILNSGKILYENAGFNQLPISNVEAV
jgi:hypothetical protein